MLTKFYSLEDFAREVGESIDTLTEKRRAGTFFAPDTALSRQPYWFRETVEQYMAMKTDAIRQAWHGGKPDSSDSGDTLGMRW